MTDVDNVKQRLTEPPPAARRGAANTYHGVTVTDDYQWLEDGTSDETQRWTRAQDAHTRVYIGALPNREAVRERVSELMHASSVAYGSVQQSGTTYFAVKQQPPRQQPFLVTLDDLDDLATETVVVDPNEIDPGGHTAIEFYEPSPDGGLVAVSLSKDGTEDGTLYVYEVARREVVGSPVPRVRSGSVAWRADGSGFWYTRLPHRGERPDADLEFYQEIWFHSLDGSADDDRRDLAGVFADDRIAQSVLQASPDGRWVMDLAERGDGGEWEIFVRPQREGATWTRIAALDDKCVAARFGWDDELWLLSLNGASRGEILRLRLDESLSAGDATRVVPAGEATIESFAVTRSRVWVADLVGGPSQVRVFDHAGEQLGTLPVLPVSSVGGLRRVGETEVVYANESFVEPRSWWRVGEPELEPSRSALASVCPIDFSGIEVVRETATSPDGTRVPLSVLQGRGTARDGSNPTLLWGYGGYGISVKPAFNPSRMLWLEQGGVLAVANLRGGGEYGDEWHRAGALADKQNVFDDFTACARHLIETGVCRSDRLALMGGSNGGLLMGAMVTQHPELARVVVAQVPVLDMLRVELHPNGAYNVTEFGTVTDPELFRALHAYSPYHNVTDDVAYPAVLLTAGEFDPRVDPYHAKKMAARLQAATTSDEPVLLRIEAGGHGLTSSLNQRIEEITDVYAFVFDRLGIGYRAVRRVTA
ncbi:MAG: prolyl oligopeptidase family serine peptidase [Propionibacteriales bacterium]|nr:prolyl oligopeptidase family serine peptidase [Propionibacteriales bacterium]